MSNLTLYHGDNFKFVKSASVDFVLTDPPFNISKKTNFASYEGNTIHSYQFDERSDLTWDSYTNSEFLTRLEEWSSEWSRVLRKGGSFAIFCADSYVSHLMDALKRNGLNPRRLVTWRKNNAVPVNRQYMPMSANEYIIVGVKEGKNVTFNSNVSIEDQSFEQRIIEATVVADKVSTIVYSKIKEAVLGLKDPGLLDLEHAEEVTHLVELVLDSIKSEAASKTKAMYKIDTKGRSYLQACIPNYIQNPLKVGNRIHPTEKPVPLLQFLVALFTKHGDLILDGFGGSGSTGEAALSLGRRAVIVEREAEYFKKLQARLEAWAG